MELRPLQETEHADIRVLLSDNKLPTEDLDPAAIEFIVAVDDARVVGVVGLETHANAGLLRSLAVDVAHRSTGLGAALVQAVEARARDSGLSQLVLLTQTAEAFFARRGYAVIDRSSAPPPVQSSAEFRSICPASATCMSKLLS
ncbi:arsenic resistance N-acetyltransferase ArsN2 [Lysobacter yangpyeongensis]|uniref:Arsenic resistance N-acetyltransferase ArsN2 n=1 Tax=Lysobacter yangpyeongensis TaxID=346182 RepID=A0ABW0SPN4_9GAMM